MRLEETIAGTYHSDTSGRDSPIALRTVASTAILSSAIVVSLRVVGSQSNDARMTRWPFSFSATPPVTPTLGTRPLTSEASSL